MKEWIVALFFDSKMLGLLTAKHAMVIADTFVHVIGSVYHQYFKWTQQQVEWLKR